jgi:hypothetical protein
MVVHTCHPSYQQSINRRIVDQASPGIKRETISKIIRQKGLGVWLKWYSNYLISERS